MLGNLAVGGPFLDAPHEMQSEGAGCRDRQKGRMGCGLRAAGQSRAVGDEVWTSSARVDEGILNPNDVVAWQLPSVSIANQCCVRGSGLGPNGRGDGKGNQASRAVVDHVKLSMHSFIHGAVLYCIDEDR
jgi:hypothetical protein